jgi:pre-rRNA-processing protein TSR2
MEQKIKYPINRDKFKQGCISIFKRWTAFRLALDNNPQILTYYNEDQTVLEINEYLEMLYDDILTTIIKNNNRSNLIDEVSDCLFTFMSDYFQIDLEDQSDSEIANILINLFNELKNGKDILLNNLKNKENKSNMKYNVDFPILGNQKVIFEKEEEDIEESFEEEEEKNNERNNNKMETDDVDEDGFTVVKKGKGKKY